MRMSSVFVYVGQCGNQIGSEFLGAAADYTKRRAYKGNVFHSSDGKLKSIHVDTESKVLAGTVSKLSNRILRARRRQLSARADRRCSPQGGREVRALLGHSDDA